MDACSLGKLDPYEQVRFYLALTVFSQVRGDLSLTVMHNIVDTVHFIVL